eukprot:9567_1
MDAPNIELSPAPNSQNIDEGNEQNFHDQNMETEDDRNDDYNDDNMSHAASTHYLKVNNDILNQLQGKYLALQINDEIVHAKIDSVLSTPDDREMTPQTAAKSKREKLKSKVEKLVPGSTNQWLYTNDIDKNKNAKCLDQFNRCGNGMVNKIIAVIVIAIQITSYIAITYFLIKKVMDEEEARRGSCYGPNCDQVAAPCMVLTTGAIISVLLIGFLWADVVNVCGICHYNFVASAVCLLELFTAIACGYLIGLYTVSGFDAISGAVGILFVHDLDERVFASMEIISRRKKSVIPKKLIAVFLWILVSIALSFALACKYTNGSYIADAHNQCLQGDFQCDDGRCIWGGFICNGVKDCISGEDEGENSVSHHESHDHDTCDFSLVECPPDYFMCLSTGECLPNFKTCDGILDCEDGSDEGRTHNCSQKIIAKHCEELVISYNFMHGHDDRFHQSWSGQFKCNNGQCIPAEYACDGIPGDCVDLSDEYPFYNQLNNYPFLRRCPYPQLLECGINEYLCKIDGKCIEKSQRCDGVLDCDDGADEKGCKYTCDVDDIISQKIFQCGGAIAAINETDIILFNGEVIDHSNMSDIDTRELVLYYIVNDTGLCITNEWRCDGTVDCDDSSDEMFCNFLLCDEDHEYQCSDGKCIPTEWLCDFGFDCSDKSDEDAQVCSQYNKEHADDASICADGYFNCPNTKNCIVDSWLCDGYSDCYPNFEDEDESICETYRELHEGHEHHDDLETTPAPHDHDH